jgi:Transposase domain (DUF772)
VLGSSRPDRELLDAAALCGHLLGEGSVHAFLAEHRRRLFPDELFADLFPSGPGRPSVPADVVATVMVLQALEGRSDREACRGLQTDIAWKAAAGLALTDGAFHPTVLTLWRNKLRASEDPERVFHAVRAVIAETGVIARKHRRALDSTVLDDAVARQDTVTMLVTQIRRVRKLVSELAQVWVRDHNLTAGRPPCDWDDPADVDGWSPSWSTTPTSWCGPPTSSSSPRRRPTRWHCWRWSPARTWNRAMGLAGGGSPGAPPRTG